MTYLFEQLGEDDFQRLCQSLLVQIFPNVQCLPLNQPDGGRDAFVITHREGANKEFIVFQVKFSRNPSDIDERDAINKLITSETNKVNNLIKQGAKAYYFLTNVKGTSHFESGSIDKTNKLFSEHLKLESYCWWRDDIERRLDSASDIKWSFPNLLRATDLLQRLLNTGPDVEDKTTKDIIAAYMAYQYTRDAQLKFKQIELHKSIIEQFIDVPARIIAPNAEDANKKWRKYIGDELATLILRAENQRAFYDYDDEDQIPTIPTGATQLLSDDRITHAFPRIVIEGAPGQGKSTVTQFLCQIYRMMLLPRSNDLSKVSNELIPREVRIPFRVDLRDYAAWIQGMDPFSDVPDTKLPQGSNPVLESFLSAQVSRYTGHDFSPAHFLKLSRASQLLIVLDGFDEVADVPTRNRLVAEISDAANRIETAALSVQIIVTSRPAAFANSPGFPRDEWQHIQLLSLSQKHIDLFTRKWLDSRDADARERRDVNSVLSEKLTQPHVRDLARNPMQLAILLALIAIQGASLPDRRTALYDRYMDVFFNREAEKSSVVRAHRELLIRIHRYIAYYLHASAEAESKSGSLSEIALKTIIRDYLSNSGAEDGFVDALFTGLHERVGALVSRVQGTYEFEVQPLREYFAGRYLYDTAPYSPSGAEKGGALPERFNAIARNPYWLNVTRFYAGCYSSGELASLVEEIFSLATRDEFKFAPHIPYLTTLLLSDYIFDHRARLAERLINYITEEPILSILLANGLNDRGDRELTLPPNLGQNKLFKACFEKLMTNLAPVDRYHIAKIVAQNGSSTEICSLTLRCLASNLPSDQFIGLIASIDFLSCLTVDQCVAIVQNYGPEAAAVMLQGGREDLTGMIPGIQQHLLEHVLETGSIFFFRHRKTNNVADDLSRVGYISLIFSDFLLMDYRNAPSDLTLINLLSRYAPYQVESRPQTLFSSPDSQNMLSRDFCSALDRLINSNVRDVRDNYEYWSDVVETARTSYGERWAVWRFAIVAMYFCKEIPHSKCSLQDETIQIMHRLAYARLNGSNDDWWLEELGHLDGESSLSSNIILMVALINMRFNSIMKHVRIFDDGLDRLSLNDWDSVLEAVMLSRRKKVSTRAAHLRIGDGNLPAVMSPRLAAALINMLNTRSADRIYDRYLANYSGVDKHILEVSSRVWMHRLESDPAGWGEAVKVFRLAHDHGASNAHFRRLSRGENINIPVDIAEEICADANHYHLDLVSAAQKSLSIQINSKIVAVSDIAKAESWIFEG
jgi:hypothetical protein